MIRLLVGCAAVVAVLTFAAGAPVPKGADRPHPYFPTRVGDTSVYRMADGYEYTTVVVAVETRGREKLVRVDFPEPNGRVIYSQRVSVSDEGLSEVGSGVLGRLGPRGEPDQLLRLPHRPGVGWEERRHQREGEFITKYTQAGPEWVEVPAGKFHAIRVTIDRTLPGHASEPEVIWYSQGVGKVKRRSGGPGTEEVLMSFTPGKD